MDGTLIKFHFLKLQEGSNSIPGLDGGGFFGPYSFIILKGSYQDLSNEKVKRNVWVH